MTPYQIENLIGRLWQQHVLDQTEHGAQAASEAPLNETLVGIANWNKVLSNYRGTTTTATGSLQDALFTLVQDLAKTPGGDGKTLSEKFSEFNDFDIDGTFDSQFCEFSGYP